VTSSDTISKLSPFDQAVFATRFLSVDGVEKANSGHPGTPMGLAAIGVEIFANHLRFLPNEPQWANRDRFVLSCGHASMLLYSLLHLSGYDLTLQDLKDFRQWGSKTAGHPEFGHAPGIETTTGPLGQGISNAVGLALAGKMAGARVNDGAPLIDYKVYVLASDGDLMEGVSYESCSLAGHLKLDNLVVVYDANNITIDGKAEDALTEDMAGRFTAQGWTVEHVDGHNAAQVSQALATAKKADRPALIIAKTHIGFGAPTKQDTSGSHGSPLGATEIEAAKNLVGWPLEPFFAPAGAYEAFAPGRARNTADHSAWSKRVAALSGEKKVAFQSLVNPVVPADLLEQLVAVAGDKTDATRSHSGRLQQKVAELVPSLIGGAADLAASTKTWIKGSAAVVPGEYGGRNLNFGIREHGMGSILNGLSLSGFFIPFGSTFLIFGDYMRPPMRLAALMGIRAIYPLTHDSLFLGEDGPTHQPVEQMWTMRMVPNLDVVRPADAMECAAAWAYAVSRADGPTVLALTRHNVPGLKRPAGFDPKSMLDGAYVLSDVENPELVLIATGSEVGDAVVVQATLAAAGKRVRVVSMPCVDAFLRLPKAKQDQILPPGVRRASYELSVTLPWRAITGLDGICIGVDQFGASAPFELLQEKYGVSAELAAKQILAAL